MQTQIKESKGIPVQVFSLYELMQRYHLEVFAVAIMGCQMATRDLNSGDILGLLSLPEDLTQNLVGMVSGLRFCLSHLECDRSLLAQIESFESNLKSSSERRPAVLKASLEQILLGVEEVLKTRLFMFLPAEQAIYYSNLEHFGKSVGMFPDALGDMLETSNCYAAGRATACVFHAMRVCEHGLRHIANQLGIHMIEGSKPCPIEYATWEQVLIRIETERAAIRTGRKSSDNEAKTIEYAALADHLSHLKDLWRNPTMHARGLYSMPESLGVMRRVAEFMNLIAGSVYAPPVDEAMAKRVSAMITVTKELGSPL